MVSFTSEPFHDTDKTLVTMTLLPSVEDKIIIDSYHCSKLTAALIISSIEGWSVVSWLVHVSSSSCKGTSRLLHIMGSNTTIFVF